jgi:hypothetical protein
MRAAGLFRRSKNSTQRRLETSMSSFRDLKPTGPNTPMVWHKEATHRLISANDVKRLTGLSAQEIVLQRDIQQLVLIDPDSARRDFFRVPTSLVAEMPEPKDSAG